MWLFTRYFILNNVLALSISLLFLKTVRIPSYKIGSILLILLFFYDIFWVFFSDEIFNDNVMVYVAKNIELPILIECPHFAENHPIP